MTESIFLRDLLIILAAAVAIVPIFRRLGVSAVLGYLFAGALIGPFALNLVRDVERTAILAEFGVVFLLFAIGLELSVDRLMTLKRYVFGLGAAQVIVTAAVIWGAVRLLGVDSAPALVLAGGLALSSTAVVLQLLIQRGELAEEHGRISFAILLFQDLAVVPLLTLVPLLGREESTVWGALGDATLRGLLVLAAIMVIGRLVMRPALRAVARGGNPELFTGIALLLVLGVGWITDQAGLSMALGAFLAGLLISDTEYRPQVQGDIEPFRGILLALFFVAVGMGVDLDLLVERWALVLALSAGLVALKASITTALALLFRLKSRVAAHVGVTLAEGGEFAFVLFSLAGAAAVLDAETEQLGVLVVGVTMAVTPLLAFAGRQLGARMGEDAGPTEEMAEIAGTRDHVIIAGFGRVGQTLARLMADRDIPVAALDLDPELVAEARNRGLPVFFGDASRADVLKAVGLDAAKAMVVTLDEPESALRAVRAVRALAPDLPILVRARDISHCDVLEETGATEVIPEIVEGSLQLGSVLLRHLEIPHDEIVAVVQRFRKETYRRLDDLIEAEPTPAPIPPEGARS